MLGIDINMKVIPSRLFVKLVTVCICLGFIIGSVSGAVRLKQASGTTPGYNELNANVIYCSNGLTYTMTGANLQTAIWSLNDTGGKVIVPQATIDVTNAISLGTNSDHIIIEGYKSYLRQTAGSTDSTFELSGCDNITITGFIINGQKSLQVYGADAYKQHGIILRDGNQDVTISDCYIYDTLGCGVFVANGCNKNIIIKDNTLVDTGDVTEPNREGIMVLYCDNVQVTGNLITGSYGANIAVAYSVNVLIENNIGNGTVDCTGSSSMTSYLNENVIMNSNHIINNVGTVVSGNPINSESDDKITISNNVIDGFWNQGIYLYGIVGNRQYYFSITGNIINGSSGNELYGIMVQYASNGTISNNVISNIIGVDTYGILLTDSVHSVSVTGNSIYECDVGLVDSATNYNNHYSGNVLTKMNSYGIRVDGDNSSFSDNNLYSCDTGIYESANGDYNVFSNNKIVGGSLDINKVGGVHSLYTDNILGGVFTDNMSRWISNSNGRYYPVTQSGLQQAIYNLNSTNGGLVHIPPCTIEVTSPILINSSITIEGSGIGTTSTGSLPLLAGYVTILNMSNAVADYTIKVGSNARMIQGVHIKNLIINGKASSTPVGGILFRNIQSGSIEDVVIQRFTKAYPYGIGINITSDATKGSYFNTLKGISIYKCRVGIKIDGKSPSSYNNGNTILSGCIVGETGYVQNVTGLWISSSNTNWIGNVDFENLYALGSRAVYISGADSGFNKFFGSRFEGNNRSVKIESASAGANHFYACTFSSSVSGNRNVTDDGVLKSTFDNCLNYVTENWGTGTLLAGQSCVNITHGLSTTATIVVVTFRDVPTVGLINVTADRSTTQFMLRMAAPAAPGNLRFYWYAKV